MTGPFHLSRNAVAKYLRIDWETKLRVYLEQNIDSEEKKI